MGLINKLLNKMRNLHMIYIHIYIYDKNNSNPIQNSTGFIDIFRRIYIYITQQENMRKRKFFLKKRYYIPRVPLACPSTNSL